MQRQATAKLVCLEGKLGCARPQQGEQQCKVLHMLLALGLKMGRSVDHNPTEMHKE